jgi:hypothetical protein
LLALLSIVLLWSAVLTGAASPPAPAKPVLGGVEEVLLIPAGITVRARVDTGAATSSLDASEIKAVEGKERRTIHFAVRGDDGRRVSLTLPLAGYRMVINTSGQTERRPSVVVDVCLAGSRMPLEVTLHDRSRLQHRMLLGRNVLEGRFVVDVARTLTAPAVCPPP